LTDSRGQPVLSINYVKVKAKILIFFPPEALAYRQAGISLPGLANPAEAGGAGWLILF